MPAPGRIVRVNVSSGGVPKRAVARARLGVEGLEGDRQKNRRFHGGPDRAVCLYSVELLAKLAAEGHTVSPGALGETVTTEGIDLSALVVGSRLRLGASALIEITARTPPCQQIAACFQGGDFTRISPKKRPEDARLYARVLAEGDLAPGDPVEVLPGRTP